MAVADTTQCALNRADEAQDVSEQSRALDAVQTQVLEAFLNFGPGAKTLLSRPHPDNTA